MTHGLETQIRELHDGAAVLELSGEIDMATESVMAAAFNELADRGFTDVVIDAREVGFMDSTGINALVGAKQMIHQRGSRVILVASPAVRRVLDLVFPEPLFAERLDTMEEALAELEVKQT